MLLLPAQLYLHEQFTVAAARIKESVTGRPVLRLRRDKNRGSLKLIRATLRQMKDADKYVGILLSSIACNWNDVEEKVRVDFGRYVNDIGELRDNYNKAAREATGLMVQLRDGRRFWFCTQRGFPGLPADRDRSMQNAAAELLRSAYELTSKAAQYAESVTSAARKLAVLAHKNVKIDGFHKQLNMESAGCPVSEQVLRQKSEALGRALNLPRYSRLTDAIY